MSTSNRESTPSSESLLQRLFNRRQAPKYLFVVVCLVTLAVLFVSLARRQTAIARPGTIDGVAASAERAAAEKLVPPPVPDDQNFAATSFFAQIMENPSSKASDDIWPEEFSRTLQWPHRTPLLPESADGRRTGRFPTDLVAWKKTFENVLNGQSPSGNEDEIPISDRPDAVTNAQAALAVLEALKPYEPVLRELQAACKRPHARFNVHYDWENPWGIRLPQLAIIKRTCQLLRLKASAELAAGKPEEALRDVLLMLRLIDASKDEPVLISQLVRVAALELTFQPIWEGLAQRRWSEAQLQSLQTELQKVHFIADLHRVLEAERTWANLTIALVRDKRTPNLFASMMTAEDGKTESWVREADQAFQKCPRDWFDAEQRNYSRLCEERMLKGYDVAASRVYPRMLDENAHLLEKELRNKDTLIKQHLVFAKALLAGTRVHSKLAGTQGYTDLAVVACALERHRLATGQFPEKLSALAPRFLRTVPHDLVSGEALHYQRTEDGQFLLYSVGWNEADDHGELAFLASGRSVEKKEGDWVWRYASAKGTPSFE